MMNREQFLLTKLMEECGETIQRASKQIQFGSSEVQIGQDENNAQRLRGEINDILAIVRLLEEYDCIRSNGPDGLEAHVQRKKTTIHRYMRISIKKGLVEP